MPVEVSRLGYASLLVAGGAALASAEIVNARETDSSVNLV
jgi:hypothetical protein